MGWMTEESGFNSLQGQDIFLFSITFRLALGPTQPPLQGVQGQVKWQELEADHLPSSSPEVRNSGATPSLPSMSSWHGA
jgi:hypothetical protein